MSEPTKFVCPPQPPCVEFDPTSEQHFHLLTVKAVEPGCTTEIQIEGRSGEVSRLSTTDNEWYDDMEFCKLLLNRFRAEWKAYCQDLVTQE